MTRSRLAACFLLVGARLAAFGATKADKPVLPFLAPTALNETVPAIPAIARPLVEGAGLEQPVLVPVAPRPEPSPHPLPLPGEGAEAVAKFPRRLAGLSEVLDANRPAERQAAALDAAFSGAAGKEEGERGVSGLALAEGKVPPEEAIAYLKSLKKIRVAFVNAPGFGHQMATVSLIRRLRELGCEGEIEAVYKDLDLLGKANRVLRDKLGQLLPEFNPIGHKVQLLRSVGVTMRNITHEEDSLPRVSFGLTGGADGNERFADKYNVDTFLRLGPMDWHRHYRDQVYFRALGAGIPVDVRDDAALLYRPGSEAINDDWFGRLKRANVDPSKAAGLRTLVRGLGEHDVLASYGLAKFRPSSLAVALASVARAMDERPELFRKRGVVVPLLLDVDSTVTGVEAIVAAPEKHNADVAPTRLPAVIAAKRRLGERLKIASIGEPGLKHRLGRLGSGDILVVKTGGAPPALFEHFFKRSTLPPTVEGKNAQNLCRLLGIPFLPLDMLQLNALMQELPELGADRQAVQGLLYFPGEDGPMSLALALRYAQTEFAVEPIAAYIAAALTPGSPLRRMFADARLGQDDYARDKLVSAVQRVLFLQKSDLSLARAPRP